MPRLWLRCAVGDPSTGTIVERWDDVALPRGLRLAQLRSPGPPLAKGRTSVLLAVPLTRAPRTRQLLPVASRVRRLKALATCAPRPSATSQARAARASRVVRELPHDRRVEEVARPLLASLENPSYRGRPARRGRVLGPKRPGQLRARVESMATVAS